MAEHDDMATLADFLEKHPRLPHVLKVTDPRDGTEAPVPMVPEANGGWRVNGLMDALDSYRSAPVRRRGTMKAETLLSAIDLVSRYQSTDSILFASTEPPKLTAVFNADPSGSLHTDAGFGDHRVEYAFPLSDEWKAWQAAEAASPMGQIDFAAFLEDRILDVMEPPAWLKAGADTSALSDADMRLRSMIATLGGRLASPAQLMELSRGLAINENSAVKGVFNLDTGEREIRFDTEHTDDKGKPVKVPNMFLVAAPVFQDGEAFRMPVRLRYRVRSGQISWILARIQADEIFRIAFREGCQMVADQTGLPLFYGAPK